jgi:hypothetical protein
MRVKMESKETLFVLTKADRDRIEAAMGLLRQIVRELLSARRTRVNCATHTPGALHQLAEDVEKVHAASRSCTAQASCLKGQLHFPEI